MTSNLRGEPNAQLRDPSKFRDTFQWYKPSKSLVPFKSMPANTLHPYLYPYLRLSSPPSTIGAPVSSQWILIQHVCCNGRSKHKRSGSQRKPSYVMLLVSSLHAAQRCLPFRKTEGFVDRFQLIECDSGAYAEVLFVHKMRPKAARRVSSAPKQKETTGPTDRQKQCELTGARVRFMNICIKM